MKRIPLTQGKFALVDDVDYVFLMQWKWYAASFKGNFYARRNITQLNGKRVSLSMHREILGLLPGDGKHGDHINHNVLDNRRSNLRVCNNQQNSFNQKKQNECTSQYKGVYQKAGRANWAAQIYHNGKNSHIGHFGTQEEAARAYNVRAIELFGEFAHLNSVEAL